MNSTSTTLPKEATELINAFILGLQDILGQNLYGVYLYGASVFPDSGSMQDIDCHVIICNRLTEAEKAGCLAQSKTLGEQFPGWGEELDAYVILLADAKGHQVPRHQLLPEVYDHSWALHCAHIRAGYYRLLYGPEPTEIFPAPTWGEIDSALRHELQFVLDHPQYPAYGILNLCRILYSYNTRDPAVSKQFSGRWGVEQFPQWANLIQAAMRFYRKEQDQEDLDVMENQRADFYAFMTARIEHSRWK